MARSFAQIKFVNNGMLHILISYEYLMNVEMFTSRNKYIKLRKYFQILFSIRTYKSNKHKYNHQNQKS